MRVGLLSYNAQFGDAIGNLVAEEAGIFAERGADVRVFVESDRRLHPQLRGICRRLSSPTPSGPAWEFLSRADLIIVEYSQFYSLVTLLPLLDQRKTRILFDYHGVTPAEFFSGSQREALERGSQERGWVWCADLAVAHSRFMARELHQATGFPADRIDVQPHPVDRNRFSPGAPGRDLRRVLGIGEARILLFVGRLAPNKRLRVLVEALARLREQTPPIHAVIVGDPGDVYQVEAESCRALAAERGVAERLHFLGQVGENELLDAYRSADVFVMPSVHEGFSIPVVEAMACGVPVVGARATALPETIGSAGLTFRPDDAEDLEKQIRRVLRHGDRTRHANGVVSPLRVAVVSFRYGADFAGGAEHSLSILAATLHRAGHAVEVFTTCTRSENHWANDLPEGTVEIDGLRAHRFRIEAHDRDRHLHSVRAILEADGPVTDDLEREYLLHSIHSSRLLDRLNQRIEEFDAIVVGPYLHGLTCDIARAFPEKTLLLPCFHDEPFAHLRIWLDAYSRVGCILYHSPEERDLAESMLGLNHPGGFCIGTYLESRAGADRERGRTAIPSGRRYVVYCGRYSARKNLPLLLHHARHYAELHPERFIFAFMGEGEVAVPQEKWARDLGFVDREKKGDILAGADALVQLSQNESLSLVALEAWVQGTPVIAHRACPPLAGHLRRCHGGWAVDSFQTFAAALDALWEQPEQGRLRGQRGRAYVMEQYGNREIFLRKLTEAIGQLRLPLAERMRGRGLERALLFDRTAWRERFGQIIEAVLEAPPRSAQPRLEIQPRQSICAAAEGQDEMLVPVRVANRGTGVAVHEGPARLVLGARVRSESGDLRPPLQAPDSHAPLKAEKSPQIVDRVTPLPCLILPGQEVPVAIAVGLPSEKGSYHVDLYVAHAESGGHGTSAVDVSPRAGPPDAWLQLKVTAQPAEAEESRSPMTAGCVAGLQAAHKALAEAARRQQLPDDYLDVTEGLLAGWKRRLKRKLLGNFKHAYVDVLSRQQTRFNRLLLTALQELVEYLTVLNPRRAVGATRDGNDRQATIQRPEDEFLSATIERAVKEGRADDLAALFRSLLEETAQSRQRLVELEERLTRLEQSPTRAR
jgi:O-antigen biosynthesis protein